MRNVLFLFMLLIVLISCENEERIDPYLVGNHQIGMLTDSTQIKDLDKIFAEDSIVKRIKGDEFMAGVNDIEIFSAEGIKLLTLSPLQILDSTSVVKSIHIHDSSYKTDKNISTLSTFKDINDNYEITKINNLINSIVVSVNEINATFTIDKKELPTNLRYDMDVKIEKSQIPDNAKIKYFMLHW